MFASPTATATSRGLLQYFNSAGDSANRHQSSLSSSCSPSASAAPAPGDSFVRTAWVRRLGADPSSALPVHVKPEYSTVADILLAAHRLLYTSKDAVAPSDLELVIADDPARSSSAGTKANATLQQIPLSNLDTLEVVAAFRRRELQIEHQLQQQQQLTNDRAPSTPIGEKPPLRQQQQQNHNFTTEFHTNSYNQSEAVDVYLILRRRHRAAGAGNFATSSLIDAVLVIHDPNIGRERTKVSQSVSTPGATNTTTPPRLSLRTATPNKAASSSAARLTAATSASPPASAIPAASASSSSNRSARLRREYTVASTQSKPSSPARPSSSSTQVTRNSGLSTPNKMMTMVNESTPQSRAMADAQLASFANDNNNKHHLNSLVSPTSNSSLRQQPPLAPLAVSSGRRRASPSRQEIEDGVLRCSDFAPKWLKDEFCDKCNRPKRLHTFEAIGVWAEKAKRHASPSLSKHRDYFSAIAAASAAHKKPLWKPKAVTQKVNAEVNPLSCSEFIPTWGRESFCSRCHGPRDAHTRVALAAYVEKHKEAGIKEREWTTQRPLPGTSFEERKEHRMVATAARCEAFVPLWNNNQFCAICFQPETAHSMEKRFFNFPSLFGHHHHAALVPGQKPDYLTNYHHHSSSAARNWWIVNFPWRHVVVFLPFAELFSLASCERWLCVELRPLLRSALSLIVAHGVTAHQELRSDAVRLSSHLESCSAEIRGHLSRVLDGLFDDSSEVEQQQRHEKQRSDVDDNKDLRPGSDVENVQANKGSIRVNKSKTNRASSSESIMLSGTVGSRSALRRKLSRAVIPFDRILVSRREVLEHLQLLENEICVGDESSLAGRVVSIGNSKKAILTPKQGDDHHHTVTSPASSSDSFENVHALAALKELVRILRKTETQHETCRRALKYLNQEVLPL